MLDERRDEQGGRQGAGSVNQTEELGKRLDQTNLTSSLAVDPLAERHPLTSGGVDCNAVNLNPDIH